MRIILGTDLSIEALAAAQFAMSMVATLREQKVDVEFEIVFVTEPQHTQPSGVRATFEDPDNRRRLEAQVREWLTPLKQGVVEYELIFSEGGPTQELARHASAARADWLIVGMSGRGAFARMMVGSTAHNLAHRPPCNLILVHRERPLWSAPPRWAVGVDFSAAGDVAIDLAIREAARFNARLSFVHVVAPPRPVAMPNGFGGYAGMAPDDTQAFVDNAHEMWADLVASKTEALKGIDYEFEVVVGYPARELVVYAEEKAIDAMVLGTVGRSALNQFFLGSVANGVVKRMPCTVILTPPVSE